ncbi:hypothetical protein I4U23_005461 [Adineta vaga]|nr:hypothetical protein I4U23_005461 [Adineta vaga]
MNSVFFGIIFFQIISGQMRKIPVIHNVSMQILSLNSPTIINGSCKECLCFMLRNPIKISSLNCFRNNETCEIFTESYSTNQLLLFNNFQSSIYFLSLPFDNIQLSTNIIQENTNHLQVSSTTTPIYSCGKSFQSQYMIEEYYNANLSCPFSNQTINIVDACYGVNDSSVCNCQQNNCIQMNVTQYLASYCANSSIPSICQFYVGGSFFTDTCSGHKKNLWLTYNCN